jgi:FMN phosphatase YigB (HAD superfamily)
VIEAVTFDFWNTIARVPPDTMTEARRRAVAAACEECGVEVEAARLAASLEEVGSSYQRSWEAGDHFHPREGAEMLVRALGAEGAAGEMVAEAFLTAGRTAELLPAPEIGAALEELRRRGIRLGIVCDVGFSGGELCAACSTTGACSSTSQAGASPTRSATTSRRRRSSKRRWER